MPNEQAARQSILELLQARRTGASICPSEAARQLDATNWRAHMDLVRKAGRSLQQEGQIAITQGGRPLSHWPPRGPIRFRQAEWD